jgi:hypothetical protein
MAIGRAIQNQDQRQHGRLAVSSGTDEEVEKLQWAERWGADTVMDLSTGGDLDACREAIIENSHHTHRHRADLLDDHRQARSKTSTKQPSSKPSNTRPARAWTTSPSTPACSSEHLPWSRIG